MRYLLLPLLVLLAAPASLAQPANDDLANLAYIGESDLRLGATITGTNTGATVEPGEASPSCQSFTGASVWWEFTVRVDGTFTFDFADSDFDTVIALYTGSTLDLPTEDAEVACDDDGGPGTTSRFEDLTLPPGHYYLRVAGFDDGGGPATGTISFTITPPPRPANDGFASALQAIPGANTGTNGWATVEPGEAEPMCESNQEASVWWIYTPPSDGTVSLDFTGTFLAAVASLYLDTFPSLPTQGDELACTWVTPDTPTLTDVAVQGGTSYAIRVAGFSSSIPRMGDISFDLSFTPASTAPPNDDLANASLPQEPTTTGTNVGATVEPGEPDASCQPNNGASVWWSFGVAEDALLTLDFANSDFDTVASLYEQTPGGLVQIACNDDRPGPGTTSLLSEVSVRSNVGYYLRVAGFDGGGGPATGTISFELAFAPPTANEGDAAAALSLSASPNPTRGDARVRLSVAETELVTVAVFDATGRRVAVLHEGLVSAGAPLELRLSALPAGVYAVRALGETLQLTERVTVVR